MHTECLPLAKLTMGVAGTLLETGCKRPTNCCLEFRLGSPESTVDLKVPVLAFIVFVVDIGHSSVVRREIYDEHQPSQICALQSRSVRSVLRQ
jgi:hypothetical protein